MQYVYYEHRHMKKKIENDQKKKKYHLTKDRKLRRYRNKF